MTTVIKCSTCNIVIDEMLAFVQNKISVMDDDSLVQILRSSFESDEIKRSKTLLFESLPTDKRNITRKKAGKETRDLIDIISLFRGSNSDMRPTFVARDLEKLPPITFDHVDVTKLLKDLVLLQSEIKEIKSNCVTKDQLEDVKTDILKSLPSTSNADQSSPNCWRSMNVNMRRGGSQAVTFMDSGPIGLSHLDMTIIGNSDTINKELSLKRKDDERSFHDYPQMSVEKNKARQQALTRESVGTVPSEHETSFLRKSTSDNLSAISTPSNTASGQVKTKTLQGINAPTKLIHSESEPGTGWQVVQRRKTKLNYRYLSKTGSACENIGKFKAAETAVPIFITKVHKDTTEHDITEYIREKTQEVISLERIVMKQVKDHNAFKFFVSENKVNTFLNDSLWPQGILFRRFMHFKQRSSVYGTQKQINGR